MGRLEVVGLSSAQENVSVKAVRVTGLPSRHPYRFMNLVLELISTVY